MLGLKWLLSSLVSAKITKIISAIVIVSELVRFESGVLFESYSDTGKYISILRC
jgi:hypothetical protein